MRQSDAVARLGGGEFVVLLKISGQRRGAVAHQDTCDIAKPFDILGREIGTRPAWASASIEDGEDE